MIVFSAYQNGLTKMSREKNLAKNTFIIAFGTFLPKMSSIITLPIITAGLTKKEYGTYDLISTLVALFLPIATLQIQAAAFRFLIDFRDNEKETRRIVTNIFTFILPISLVALTILYVALYKLNILIRCLICCYFFVDILMLTCQQIVRGLANNALYSASSVVCAIVNMILIVFLVREEKQGLEGVLLSLTISATVGLGILIFKGGIFQKIDFTLLSFQTMKSLLGYSWPMIPNSLSIWILNFSDRLVLTTFLGLEATAIYAVATKIPSLLSTVQSTFVYAWQENASLASKDADADTYYSKMFDSFLGILVGAMALLIAFTPILFVVLIRGDYEDAYYQMPILFMGMLFSAMSSYLGGIYGAHKRTKSIGITTVGAAILNFVIDIVLVNVIGVYAASVSTLISYFALLVFRMIDIKKFQPMTYNLPQMCLYMAILLVICILSWMNTSVCNITNFIISCIFAYIVNKRIIVVLFRYGVKIFKGGR